MTDYTYGGDADAPEGLLDESTASAPTLLSKLEEIITQDVSRPHFLLEVPERPGVSIKINPNFRDEALKSWRKWAGEGRKGGMDSTKFAARVVAQTTVGILVGGEEVLTAEGAPVSFASREILAMTDSTKPYPDAVIRFFGLEPHVETAALYVLEKAGYGDDLDEVDPSEDPTEG